MVIDFLENYVREAFGIHNHFARFEFVKSRGQIYVQLVDMLGYKTRFIELKELVGIQRMT
jgi:hypothetical protein